MDFILASISVFYVINHDWTVHVGAWVFGIQAIRQSGFVPRSTGIFYGPDVYYAPCTVYAVLGIAAVGFLVLTFAAACLIAHRRARPSHDEQAGSDR